MGLRSKHSPIFPFNPYQRIITSLLPSHFPNRHCGRHVNVSLYDDYRLVAMNFYINLISHILGTINLKVFLDYG